MSELSVPFVLLAAIVASTAAFLAGVFSTWNGWGRSRCMRCGAIGNQKRGER